MQVRVTGVLIEGDEILLVDQDTDSGRSWSLPGGKVEEGETLAEQIVTDRFPGAGGYMGPKSAMGL